MSMVTIDRLVIPIKIKLKEFFNKQQFFDAPMEKVYSIIVSSEVIKNIDKVHFIFKKRYFERIFATIREEISKLLEKQVDSLKKKKDVTILVT